MGSVVPEGGSGRQHRVEVLPDLQIREHAGQRMEGQDLYAQILQGVGIFERRHDAHGRPGGHRGSGTALHRGNRSGRRLGRRRSDDLVHPGECAVSGRWHDEHHPLRGRGGLRHLRRDRARLHVRAGALDQGVGGRVLQLHFLPHHQRRRVLSGRRGRGSDRSEAPGHLARDLPGRPERFRRPHLRSRQGSRELHGRDDRSHERQEGDRIRGPLE